MLRFSFVFLVLLRLAIGWHFLFEGLQKLHSHAVGPTATSKPFSSAGYFREAPGPMGGLVRWAVGDPDEQALSLLVVAPLPDTEEPANDKPASRMPSGLRKAWQALADRYVAEYGADKERAAALVEQHGAMAVRWLEYAPDKVLDRVRSRFGKLESVDLKMLSPEEGVAYDIYANFTTEQKRPFPTGEVDRRMTMAERIAEYRLKLTEVRDRATRKAWQFGKDVEGPRLRTAKADLARLRTGMLTDLEKTQTASFVQALNNLAAAPLADPVGELAAIAAQAQKTKGMEGLARGLAQATAMNNDLAPLSPTEAAATTVTPVKLKLLREQVGNLAGVLPTVTKNARADAAKLKDAASRKQALEWVDVLEKAPARLATALEELPEVEALKPEPANPVIWWMDFLTRWGLTVIGACLLAGFFTRLNCWLGAGFLLMTYLAVPSLPWMPSVGPSEGNYVFVNKNVVEMLALCALGCLPTGRWFGADGLLAWIGSLFFGKRSAPAT